MVENLDRNVPSLLTGNGVVQGRRICWGTLTKLNTEKKILVISLETRSVSKECPPKTQMLREFRTDGRTVSKLNARRHFMTDAFRKLLSVS